MIANLFLALAVTTQAADVAAAPGGLTLAPCQIDGIEEPVRCGTYEVRENRNDPVSPVLPLRIVVLPARDPDGRADPVFYFEGGPGDPATQSARYVADAWFRSNNDVVLIDQRGTGPGHALHCDLPGTDEEPGQYASEPYPSFAECGRILSRSHDLTQYVTPVFLQDVEKVRRALGYERINLYGASYGSRAAIVYARTFPQNVRTLYLSGVVPLELRMPLYFPWSAQRALDATIELCGADPVCRERYPDPSADLLAALAALDEASASTSFRDAESGAEVQVSVTRWVFASALLSKLYTAGGPEDVAAALESARRGDYSALVQAWIDGRRRSRDEGFAWGLNRVINCSEDVPRVSAQEIRTEAEGTFMGATLGLGTLESCETWPRATLPERYFDPMRLDIPTMVTSGEYDPVTPPHWGEVARQTFPNSFHLVTLQGHFNFREEGCLGEVAAAFLRSGSVDGLDLSCVEAADSGLQRLP